MEHTPGSNHTQSPQADAPAPQGLQDQVPMAPVPPPQGTVQAPMQYYPAHGYQQQMDPATARTASRLVLYSNVFGWGGFALLITAAVAGIKVNPTLGWIIAGIGVVSIVGGGIVGQVGRGFQGRAI